MIELNDSDTHQTVKDTHQVGRHLEGQNRSIDDSQVSDTVLPINHERACQRAAHGNE